MSALPPPLRGLIALLRHDLGGGGTLPAGLDGEAVAALAEAHRVTVIAERSWRDLAARSLAPEPPAALRERAAGARARALRATGHLVRLVRTFEAAGLPFVILKGPALSMQLYGDPTVRTARDLDVIVPDGRLDAAVTAAAAAGWTAPPHWRDRMRLTARHDIELRPSLAGQPLLELHAALGPPYARFELDPFAAAGRVPVASVAVPALTGPALPTYVAWHGARGLWYRLAWLVDCARLLPREESEAHRLVRTARACGAEIAVRAGAVLAARLLAVAPPPWPPAAPATARRVETVLGWALERLSLGIEAPQVWSRPGSYRWLWRELAQQDRPWRGAAAAAAFVARPTEEDAVRLGLRLPTALHVMARPCFIATRLVRDLAARPT